jgi:hypothetical protein
MKRSYRREEKEQRKEEMGKERGERQKREEVGKEKVLSDARGGRKDGKKKLFEEEELEKR